MVDNGFELVLPLEATIVTEFRGQNCCLLTRSIWALERMLGRFGDRTSKEDSSLHGGQKSPKIGARNIVTLKDCYRRVAKVCSATDSQSNETYCHQGSTFILRTWPNIRAVSWTSDKTIYTVVGADFLKSWLPGIGSLLGIEPVYKCILHVGSNQRRYSCSCRRRST